MQPIRKAVLLLAASLVACQTNPTAPHRTRNPSTLMSVKSGVVPYSFSRVTARVGGATDDIHPINPSGTVIVQQVVRYPDGTVTDSTLGHFTVYPPSVGPYQYSTAWFYSEPPSGPAVSIRLIASAWQCSFQFWTNGDEFVTSQAFEPTDLSHAWTANFHCTS